MIKKKKEIFFLNIIFILIFFLIIVMPVILPKSYYAAFSFNISFYIIFHIMSFALYSFYYKKDEAAVKKLINSLKENLTEALTLSAIKVPVILSLIFLLRYFLSLKTITGYFLSGLIIFIFLIFELSLFWYPAIVCFQTKSQGIIANLKKAFYLFFEDSFFTYKIIFLSALKLLISLPALFIFPGITGIIFYIAENYRLITEENK
ncbi:hypothetical protein E4O03_01895 [Treponema sp. OMZ 792]|uniref:hypothetical protein n=1 Tax=Treponema sp. OMZ 798 TaxID=2563671 RepID=UPI0020A2C139|nr:hypothetical protein [Treponema sp. OMZ 798]UTC75506.1 hypothetical protein E4O03_01895 [Treponema sp. OMZ 792]UTC79510.1 hypothetical protein E4O07_01910 [Treponema sp. OMZ 798]